MRFKYLLIFLLFTLFACESDPATKGASNDSSISFTDSNQPWIFRSVMDLQPRMITLSLAPDFLVSYNTETAAIYKAWKGYVDFDGAVYTTAHGPQPTSVGDAYFINEYKEPWYLVQNGKETIPNVQYRGHRIVDDQGELMYQLNYGNGKSIKVFERPIYHPSKTGLAGLQRIFTTENVPEGVQVGLKINVNSVAVKEQIKADGNLNLLDEKEVKLGKYSGVSAVGKLLLNNNTTTTLTTPFIKKPLIENENKPEVESAESPNGAKLIARSDCRSCHNTNRKTIGPSYKAIAEKYTTTDENIAMLANKIKVGGSGVWGPQVMSAHPKVPDEDLNTMVAYILAMDKNDKGADDSAAAPEAQDYVYGNKDIKEEDLFPGLVTKMYSYKKDLSKLADTRSGGKLTSSGIIPDVVISQTNMVNMDDNAAIFLQGYLTIKEEGIYNFRLASDDGSMLFINDQLVINHDGPHGADIKDGKIALKAGFHPIRIDYFQGYGGKSLIFQYKPLGEPGFVDVPREMFGHLAKDRPKQMDKNLSIAATIQVPGDQLPLNSIHPAFTISQARPDDFQPKVGGMDFLADGRLVISTWDPSGGIYLLDNLNTEDHNDIKVKQIAAGLAEPLGLKVVDNEIYVLQKQELTKLIDHNGDDIIDEYQTVSKNWKVSANFHEFAFGLVYKDGYFYATLATAINPGGASTQPQIQDRGKVVKISKADGSVEFIASGLRTPNGIGLGPNNEIFVADNQGDWLPSCKILHIQKGNWYGSRSVDFAGTANLKETPPVVWMPQDEIGNSPSTPMKINIGPYKDQLIHGEVTHGGIKRVFPEKINGQYQGALFRFTQGLEAGVNRMVWGPDGDLYVGGIGSSGNWRHDGTLWYGLQKLTYNKNSVFEMLAVRAKSNGLEIELTEPLKIGDGWNPKDYEVEQFYYKPTEAYGGPKMDLTQLRVLSATVSEDRKKVFLEIKGMKPGHMLYLHLNKYFVSDQQHELWTTEAWYNMNQIPTNLNGTIQATPAAYLAGSLNSLSAGEKEAGWELLFNGKNLDGWHTYGKDKAGSSWVVKDGALTLEVLPKEGGITYAKDGGDLTSEKEYGDFELMLEWKIADCGNSGIFFNAVESDKYHAGYLTGPEMQVLDNTCHPDSKYRTHRAGDLYDMIETNMMMVKSAGEWNEVMIRNVKGNVEFWLNGKKVVHFEMFGDEWKEMIANSKFKDMSEDFGTFRKGHIMLQDHGDGVAFRNVKIREL